MFEAWVEVDGGNEEEVEVEQVNELVERVGVQAEGGFADVMSEVEVLVGLGVGEIPEVGDGFQTEKRSDFQNYIVPEVQVWN